MFLKIAAEQWLKMAGFGRLAALADNAMRHELFKSLRETKAFRKNPAFDLMWSNAFNSLRRRDYNSAADNIRRMWVEAAPNLNMAERKTQKFFNLGRAQAVYKQKALNPKASISTKLIPDRYSLKHIFKSLPSFYHRNAILNGRYGIF